MSDPGADEALRSLLLEARDLGFLGPGPVDAHLVHAGGFAAVIEDELAGGDWSLEAAGDLGTGSGIPALPLACHFAGTSWLLIEAAVRRAAFLRRAVARLGLEDRVTVREERAEITGHDPAVRGRLDLVVARSFGPPAVVAECAAPLLRVGGRLVVSEPPGGRDERWPADGVALVGLRPGARATSSAGGFQVLKQVAGCPTRFPRRVGAPGKRPLFSPA